MENVCFWDFDLFVFLFIFVGVADEMEVRVKEIEKELGVHVERLDVMRDPMARKLYQTIDLDCECKGTLPLLYHRESRQTIYGKCSNPSRIRAWAKGRWLAYSSKYFDNADDATDNVDLTTFLPDDDDDDDGDYNEEYERLQEEAMTDMQRKGKEAMKKRMQQKQQQQQQQQQ